MHKSALSEFHKQTKGHMIVGQQVLVNQPHGLSAHTLVNQNMHHES